MQGCSRNRLILRRPAVYVGRYRSRFQRQDDVFKSGTESRSFQQDGKLSGRDIIAVQLAPRGGHQLQLSALLGRVQGNPSGVQRVQHHHYLRDNVQPLPT